jgi:Aldehyde dehydrogenase family
MCDELAELANAAIVDDGLKQGTKLGPLQNKMQYEKVKGYLDDARANGKIVAGGDAPDRPGYFIRPTIVRDIAEGTRLVDEEQFGPVLPLIKSSDPEDASPRECNILRAWRVSVVVRQGGRLRLGLADGGGDGLDQQAPRHSSLRAVRRG